MRLGLRAATMAALLIGSPALAQVDDAGADYVGSDAGYGYPQEEYAPPPAAYPDASSEREAWLNECRHRLSARDSGMGGAVIGGVVGGIAGNRIAGHGSRTIGTVAGAAVGAAAGAVIDKAEDAGPDRDECQAYLDDYYARYNQPATYPGGPVHDAYAQAPGYSAAAPYGYGNPAAGCCIAQPMMAPPPQPRPDCVETVEYVYEDVPLRPARRVIPRRTRTVPDKRVKLLPTK